MDEGSEIDLDGVVRQDLACTARCTLDFALKFWNDDAKTEPDDITTSRFDCTVKDKAGNIILAFSTELDPGGLAPDPDDDSVLVFSKTAEEMDKPAGIYTYLLERTLNGNTFPEQYGDWKIRNNSNAVIDV